MTFFSQDLHLMINTYCHYEINKKKCKEKKDGQKISNTTNKQLEIWWRRVIFLLKEYICMCIMEVVNIDNVIVVTGI